jgi:hypothetical protein
MRPSPTTTAISALGAGSTCLLTATHLPLLAGLATGLLAALFAGVVLPAVWSTRPTRRAAAQTGLAQILALARPTPTRSAPRPRDRHGST